MGQPRRRGADTEKNEKQEGGGAHKEEPGRGNAGGRAKVTEAESAGTTPVEHHSSTRETLAGDLA